MRYQKEIKAAIKRFWDVRSQQKSGVRGKQSGNRGAVTGGKQLDGFLNLLHQVAIDVGVPKECIYLRGNHIPGFFRPTKDWDMLIISPKNKLIAVLELKSQVGSFGNNFNNRTEEAIGSAVDLWTAYREKAFFSQAAPWLGYFMLVEKTDKSVTPVRVSEPHFKVFPEFHGASYIDRYEILCQKLMLERHYSQCGLLWTSNDLTYGDVEGSISLEAFINSLIGHLTSQIHEF